MEKNTDLVHLVNNDKPVLQNGDSTKNWKIILPPIFDKREMYYSKDDYRNFEEGVMRYNITFEKLLDNLEDDLGRIQTANSFYITTLDFKRDIFILSNFPSNPVFADKCIVDATAFQKGGENKSIGRAYFLLDMVLRQAKKGIFKPKIDLHYNNDSKGTVHYHKISMQVNKANAILDK